MLKSCLNVKINYVWVGAPHTGTAISFKLLNSGYASAIDFKTFLNLPVARSQQLLYSLKQPV